MQVKKMKLTDLRSAKYNPESRTDRKKIAPLMANIEEIGLIYPLAVSESGEIIDGHRRYAAIKEMGMEEVPVLIVKGNAKAIFAGVNSTTRRITGNEKMQIWLREPQALSPSDQRIHREAEANLGRSALEKIARHGGSVTFYRWTKEVCSYCENRKPAFMRDVLRWIMKHKQARLLGALIAMKQPPKLMLDAIRQDKPISPSYQVQ